MQNLRARFRAFTQPNDLGLPNGKVVAAPLALLGLILILLVAFGITGSSTGYLHQFLSNDSDARLIAGEPQGIRSDEWYVQTSWTISQVEQGLPEENQTLPGGMDATVQHDLPSTDWSVAFRPHLLGFLFLPLDQAMALKWWLPGFGLMAAVYLFAVTLIPRRPIASLAIAGSVFFMPFTQWWYLSITFWPPALAFLIMASSIWAIRGARLRTNLVLAGISGYVAVTVGMGIYVPFIVAPVYAALAFLLGTLFERRSMNAPRNLGRRLRSLIPLVVAGVSAVIVLLIWIFTRWDTIQGFMSTVYPGERLVPTGSADLSSWRSLFAAPFTMSVFGGETLGALGPNSSEAATVLLIGLFLLVPLVWHAVRRYRVYGVLDAPLIAMGTVVLVALAFLAIPGWDSIAHLLFLDRVTVGRWRLFFGIVSVVLIALLASRYDEWRERHQKLPPTILPAALATGLVALSVLLIWLSLKNEGVGIRIGGIPPTLAVGISGLFVLLTMFVVFSLGSGWTGLGTVAMLLLSVAGTALVNPVYRGVYDLNDTDVVREMKQIQLHSGDSEARWVGVGETFLPNALLVQSGLPALNGFQSAPPDEMWEAIDPKGRSEFAWNRLANISWQQGEGAPNPTNPAPDQIRMTFDSCNVFAQVNVAFVLSDDSLEQSCVRRLDEVVEGPSTLYLYEVVPAG